MIYLFVCFSSTQALRHRPHVWPAENERKRALLTHLRDLFATDFENIIASVTKEVKFLFIKLTNNISIFEQQNFNKNRNKIILQKYY